MPENPVIPPDESLARGWSAPPMPRKIVQFMESDDTLTVLCNDGTLWTLTEGGTKWIQPWPPIPQDAAPSLLARTRIAERMAEALRQIEAGTPRPSFESVVTPVQNWALLNARTALREWDALEKGDGDAEAKPRSDRMG